VKAADAGIGPSVIGDYWSVPAMKGKGGNAIVGLYRPLCLRSDGVWILGREWRINHRPVVNDTAVAGGIYAALFIGIEVGRKADRVCAFILEVGNMVHNWDGRHQDS
jgi:hypothetical protein